MVDVTPREPTHRRALARCRVSMLPETTTKVANNAITKGDVLATARIAGIQAAKRTAELIPMCHPVLVGSINVNFSIGDDYVEVEAQVETVDRTGVEMEAMTACAVAALTVYDMCKSSDRTMTVEHMALWEKAGGRSGPVAPVGGPPVARGSRGTASRTAGDRSAGLVTARARRSAAIGSGPPHRRVKFRAVTAQLKEATPPGVGKGVVGAVTSPRRPHRRAQRGRGPGPRIDAPGRHHPRRRRAIGRGSGPGAAPRDPVRLLVASSGADVLDGVAALHGWGKAAAAICRCSGQVPVIVVATGPVVSGPALLLGLADLVVMSADAVAFVSGPQMVAEFTGRAVGLQELGGTAAHAMASGLCSVESDDVDGVMSELLDYLPQNTDELPPLPPVSDSVLRQTPELRTVIPDRKAAGYDVRDVIRSLCDDGEMRELWPRWAASSSRRSPGWEARRSGSWPTNPRSWPARSTSRPPRRARASCVSATRSTCPSSAWSTPRDSCPGKDLEWRGMIRHGAELAFAYAQATVPRLASSPARRSGGPTS